MWPSLPALPRAFGAARRALPRDLLLQAVEGMERPLFVLDPDWRFRYINPAGARVLAHTVDELLGRNVWEEFPEAVGAPFQEAYERARRTGQPGSTVAWFAPLDTWFRADAFLAEAGVVVTYDDITEQLLFTDGLFERRGVTLDEGRRLVRQVASALAGRPLVELCDVLLEELAGEGAEDDIAVLAVRAHPVAGDRPPEAGPELLPPGSG